MSTQYEPGAPVSDGTIPLCIPEIAGNEWKYLRECLDSNLVSSVGPFVDKFESMVAEYVGTKNAVATVNGTAALHIALLVSGVQPGDEVLVSSLTFVAPANAVRYVGASPVFIDVDPVFWQMDPQKVSGFLETECIWKNGGLINKKSGRRVKAIIPVHILGHPVDIDSILELARKYDLVVIEDATESLGALYRNRMIGNLGDIACFSFNGNKIITSGGGGMIVTNNDGWAKKAKYLTTQAKDDPIEFIHNEIGYNYRLTNIQAALGCAQLELLPDFIEKKRSIAGFYNEQIQLLGGFQSMKEASWARSVFWMYTTLTPLDLDGGSSRPLIHWLEERKIQTRPLWHPVNLLKNFRGMQSFHVENAIKIVKRSISLPSSIGLTHSQQIRVVENLHSYLELKKQPVSDTIASQQ